MEPRYQWGLRWSAFEAYQRFFNRFFQADALFAPMFRGAWEVVIWHSLPIKRLLELARITGAVFCVQRYCRTWIVKSLCSDSLIKGIACRLVFASIRCNSALSSSLVIIAQARIIFTFLWSCLAAGTSHFITDEISLTWGSRTWN